VRLGALQEVVAMKFGATLFLRGVLVLLGLGALAFLLVEPHFEGRNAQATLFEIYFKDPFLAYVYIGSIPFFVGLWHAFKVLEYAGRNEEFSPSAVRSARIIKYCALGLLVAVAGAELFILTNESDDRAGGVAMGLFIAFASLVVAAGGALLERALKKAVDMKSENDLTV
jgi:CDP-diglyceride synthetase